jgi:hypothetical protein
MNARQDYMTACRIHQEVKAMIAFEAKGVYLKIAPSTAKSVKAGFDTAFHFTIFMKATPKKVLKTIALNDIEGLVAALEEVVASI